MRNRPMLAFAACALLAGCAVGPDYTRPDIELPQQWAAAPHASAAGVAGERWWSLYGDPVLDRLVEEALANNADLQLAAARVFEARALAGIVDADRYPAVGANASVDRTRSSTVGTFPLPADFPRTQTGYRVTLDAAWEIDLWGKYRRASEAARAELLAAEWGQESVRLALVAQVAQDYFALLALDAQEAILRRTLATRGETVELLARRVDAGYTPEIDLRQAQAEHAAARAQLAAVVQARDRQEAALAVLLGRSPRAVIGDSVARGSPGAATALWVPEGLPSELLLRRPDLREAEQRLVAANARIGAARAEYFPSIVLTAFLGSESAGLSNLFSGPAGIFQFAAGLSQPIFEAGRLGFNVEAAQARHDQALAVYRRTVASAFRDVRDAITAQVAAREALDAESARVEALRLAQDKARRRYEAGIDSRLELLVTERLLLEAELTRAGTERTQRAAAADLFKALGGGWSALPSAGGAPAALR
jgi:multidrug efflux system outer membrane protein